MQLTPGDTIETEIQFVDAALRAIATTLRNKTIDQDSAASFASPVAQPDSGDHPVA